MVSTQEASSFLGSIIEAPSSLHISRQLEEASQTIATASVVLVRKSLAWITGIILLVSTLIGVSRNLVWYAGDWNIITCLGCLNLFTLNHIYDCAGLLADEYATYQGHPPVFKCQDWLVWREGMLSTRGRPFFAANFGLCSYGLVLDRDVCFCCWTKRPFFSFFVKEKKNCIGCFIVGFR